MTDARQVLVLRTLDRQKKEKAASRIIVFSSLGLIMALTHLLVAFIFETKFLVTKRLPTVLFVIIHSTNIYKNYKKPSGAVVLISCVLTELSNLSCLYYSFIVFPETQIIWAQTSLIIYLFLQSFLFDSKQSLVLVSVKQAAAWMLGVAYNVRLTTQNTIIVVYGFILTSSFLYLITHLQYKQDLMMCKSKVKVELINKKITSVVEAISDYILVIDEEVNIIFSNNSASQKFSGKLENYLNQSKYYRRSLYQGNSENQIIDDIKAYLKNGADENVTFGLGKNSNEIIEWRGKLTDWDKTHAMVLIGRDVTDIVRMEKESLESQYKSELLRTVSHELRTPVSAIMSLSQLLKSTQDLNSENIERIEMISGTCTYQLCIINDLLDYSQIISGALKVSKVYFNLTNLLKECLKLTQLQIIDKDIKLELISSHIPDLFYSDPYRLKQIILNLLANARKFTMHGSITLVANFNECWLQIKCIDTGIGIPKDKLRLLFSQFGKIEDTNFLNPQGVGLGLFISNMLVKELGGNGIEVTSEEHHGSCFSFYIKTEILAESSDVAEEDSSVIIPSILAKTILHKNKLLVVDDTSFNITAIKWIFEKEGLDFSYALSGQEAIEKIKKNVYSCILMDCEMPMLDGWQTTKAIIDLYACGEIQHLPSIIASTAYDSQDVKQKCLECGMNDLLVKPSPPVVILNKVKYWIDKFGDRI